MTAEPAVNAESEMRTPNGSVPCLEPAPDTKAIMEQADYQLQIERVTFGATINTGNYSSVRVGAEAWVDPDVGAVETLRVLQEWIADQAPVSDLDLRHLSGQRAEYSEEIQKLEDLMDRVRRRWQICKDFCKAVGLEVPLSYAEDVPF